VLFLFVDESLVVPHDYTGRDRRRPARKNTQKHPENVASSVTSPAQKGTRHCRNVTPAERAGSRFFGRKAYLEWAIALLHLPTAAFDSPWGALVR
ncbi:MAG: hypothetical protein ACN6P8_15850, partial [Achromobacter piechaudii]